MKYTYWQTFELMKKYAELNPLQREIISFLFEYVVFNGGYTTLTESLGRSKSDVSNIRKALLSLENKGLIFIKRKNPVEDDDGNILKSSPMKSCFIVDGWMDILIGKEL